MIPNPGSDDVIEEFYKMGEKKKPKGILLWIRKYLMAFSQKMRGQNMFAKGLEKRYLVIEKCSYYIDAGNTIDVCLLSKLCNETRLIKI